MRHIYSDIIACLGNYPMQNGNKCDVWEFINKVCGASDLWEMRMRCDDGFTQILISNLFSFLTRKLTDTCAKYSDYFCFYCLDNAISWTKLSFHREFQTRWLTSAEHRRQHIMINGADGNINSKRKNRNYRFMSFFSWSFNVTSLNSFMFFSLHLLQYFYVHCPFFHYFFIAL